MNKLRWWQINETSRVEERRRCSINEHYEKCQRAVFDWFNRHENRTSPGPSSPPRVLKGVDVSKVEISVV